MFVGREKATFSRRKSTCRMSFRRSTKSRLARSQSPARTAPAASTPLFACTPLRISLSANPRATLTPRIGLGSRSRLSTLWFPLTPLEYALTTKGEGGGVFCYVASEACVAGALSQSGRHPSPRGQHRSPCGQHLTTGRHIDTMFHPRRSCAERSSCRVAEGFGPGDATTTGSALFAGRQVPIPARFAGDMKRRMERFFASFPHTRNGAFFLARGGPATPGDRYERTLHIALPGM